MKTYRMVFYDPNYSVEPLLVEKSYKIFIADREDYRALFDITAESLEEAVDVVNKHFPELLFYEEICVF